MFLDFGTGREDSAATKLRPNANFGRGYRVLRFWDNDVMEDTDAVLEGIAAVLSDPHLNPLPGRERKKKHQER